MQLWILIELEWTMLTVCLSICRGIRKNIV